MSFSDDILMAYANGELDQATRRAVEAAVLRDAALAQRLAHCQAARQRLAGPRRGATVVQLAAVRATRAATQQAARKARRGWRWSWLEWGAVAGVLALGVVIGKFALGGWQPDPQALPSVAWRDGALVAQGRLALALEQAPSGAGGVYGGSVRIVASFVAADGAYCRGFTTGGVPGVQELAGLACKSGGVWKLPALVQNQAAGARPARAELPAAVQAVAEQRSNGALLDAAAEQEAMQRAWLR
ncbi:hypothetical protein ASC94_18235 [Massilia sp. Root418]|uniref:hypothetical protein n=1 Tax=Massilia sp. Root418 TaxID=1736532 RepID=UPI000701CAA9|nr:hypothetical protein [Massilia sp. Root418]KQW91700.1 hypothetical protein ASC94_18235 [Massilia sp. Root418]